MKTTHHRGSQILAVALLLCGTTPALFGQTLVNRYEFNGNTVDSVGSFNGSATTATTNTEVPLFALNTPTGAAGPTQSIQFGMNNKSDSLKSGFAIGPAALNGLASGSVSFFFQVNDSNAGEGYAFALLGGSNQLTALTPTGSVEMRGGGVGIIGTTSGLTVNTWNHLAFTWQDTGANMDIKYFINGSQIGSTVTRTGDFSATSGLRIGGFNLANNTNNVTNQFIGRMYDLQFYDGALSTTQINTLALSPGVVIPEPSTAALLIACVFGGVVLLRRRKTHATT